ncbi:TetR family transcriptional regulator [Fluviicoccus keumensis]|uniref:TetR family transcriptional regulator n=1 Tax=Fluviicoccus keumensis TaxID=1435465 RepID=A0A4Q7YHW1_9GAMM|nr:TetR/AcrR family transcriptional regulator [Fluviicoccus keumensis]RZU36770.1 TetR family transcriptional regulator [Fluviicoccus keumensis]
MTRHEPLCADTERERILFTAARLFREYGFEKTTVREIAKACDLLPGSLHYRYRAKEDILVDMMGVAIEKTIQGITEAISGTQDPLQQVRAALQAHINVLLSGDDLTYVLLFEWRSLRGDARKEIIRERDRYERCWATMLDALKEQRLIRLDVDTHLFRLIGLGAINWMATWYKKGGEYSLDEIGESLWSVISRGILAPTHADMRKI